MDYLIIGIAVVVIVLLLRGMYLYYRRKNAKNSRQKNMQPVYDSARRQGYEIWNRG